jgi:hypothetical protein
MLRLEQGKFDNKRVEVCLTIFERQIMVGFVSLNIYGAVKSSTDLIRRRGHVRDANRRWISYFSRNLELWQHITVCCVCCHAYSKW